MKIREMLRTLNLALENEVELAKLVAKIHERNRLIRRYGRKLELEEVDGRTNLLDSDFIGLLRPGETLYTTLCEDEWRDWSGKLIGTERYAVDSQYARTINAPCERVS